MYNMYLYIKKDGQFDVKFKWWQIFFVLGMVFVGLALDIIHCMWSCESFDEYIVFETNSTK